MPKSYTHWALTECDTCGLQAHYRLQYVLEQGENTCRACYWFRWAGGTSPGLGTTEISQTTRLELERVSAEHGYEYLGPLIDATLADGPHYVRCLKCSRLSAERLGDIAWGCSCSRNTKSASSPSRKKTALGESNLPVLQWWDSDRNDPGLLTSFSAKGRKVVWWKCPECHHSFESAICLMSDFPQCPECQRGRHIDWLVMWEMYQFTPISAVPQLLAAWDDESADASAVMVGDSQMRRFKCQAGHHPRVAPITFLSAGCPACRSAKTRQASGRPTLAGANPEIASQWHPTRNGSMTAEDIGPTSKRAVWWQDPRCGHEWEARVIDRDKYQRWRCPQCKTILDSFGFQFPALALEWSAENPLDPWKVRPTAQLDFIPTWVCSTDQDHRWQTALASRVNGSDCPECREAGKSKVELDHYEAVKAVFNQARSGALVRSQIFKRRPSWTIDILVEREDQAPIAIEYDGAYWHRGELKQLIDASKSRDLIAAGYIVIRLREDSLPPLKVEAPNYFEVPVSSRFPRPDQVVSDILAQILHL